MEQGLNMTLVFLSASVFVLVVHLGWSIFKIIRLRQAERAFLEFITRDDSTPVSIFLHDLASTFQDKQVDPQAMDRAILDIETIYFFPGEKNPEFHAHLGFIIGSLRQPSLSGRANYLHKIYKSVALRSSKMQSIKSQAEEEFARAKAELGLITPRDDYSVELKHKIRVLHALQLKVNQGIIRETAGEGVETKSKEKV